MDTWTMLDVFKEHNICTQNHKVKLYISIDLSSQRVDIYTTGHCEPRKCNIFYF